MANMWDGEWWVMLGAAFPATLILTVIAGWILIPVLRSYHVGQTINVDYIKEHSGKQGTPMMGGICFILPILLVMIPFFIWQAVGESKNWMPLAMTLCLGVANAFIGFVDDFSKLSHRQNEGLRSWQKMLLQILVAALYLWGMRMMGQIDTVLDVPALGIHWDMGLFYYAAAMLVIVGTVNAVNLTDGIDGLASSVMLVACMGVCALSFLWHSEQGILCSSALMGGMVGFLIFNFHPAKVFMGDTGSLFLGGMLIGMGFMLGHVPAILVLAIVFLLDMLSSLIQILSIRLFHRRVFRIAPVHHQFQQMGWREEKIVYIFSGVGMLFALAMVLAEWRITAGA